MREYIVAMIARWLSVPVCFLPKRVQWNAIGEEIPYDENAGIPCG